jgi:hypothetical protein
MTKYTRPSVPARVWGLTPVVMAAQLGATAGPIPAAARGGRPVNKITSLRRERRYSLSMEGRVMSREVIWALVIAGVLGVFGLAILIWAVCGPGTR